MTYSGSICAALYAAAAVLEHLPVLGMETAAEERLQAAEAPGAAPAYSNTYGHEQSPDQSITSKYSR